jgi:ankyrin repeat protein
VKKRWDSICSGNLITLEELIVIAKYNNLPYANLDRSTLCSNLSKRNSKIYSLKASQELIAQIKAKNLGGVAKVIKELDPIITSEVFQRTLDYGNLDILKFIIGTKADINIRDDSEGNTPLIYAVAQDYDISYIKLLIENGADVNMTSYDGRSAIWYAIRDDITAVIKLLLENGLDVYSKVDGVNIFDRYLVEMYVEISILELFLKKGIDLNLPDKNGYTPIANYLSKSDFVNKEVLEFLLNNGSDPTIKVPPDEANLLMLHVSRKPNPEIIQFLIKNGQDILYKDKKQRNVLMHLISQKEIYNIYGNPTDIKSFVSIELLETLVDYGADINDKDFNGENSAMYYIKNDSIKTDILNYILEKTDDINHQNNAGDTILHMAVEFSNEVLLDLILKYEPDASLVNKQGISAESKSLEFNIPPFRLDNKTYTFLNKIRSKEDAKNIAVEMCKDEEYTDTKHIKNQLKKENVSHGEDDSKKDLCEKLQDIYRQKKDTKDCFNDTTLLGEELSEIPDGLFYSYTVGGKKICLPVDEIQQFKPNVDANGQYIVRDPFTREIIPIEILKQVKEAMENVLLPPEPPLESLSYSQLVAKLETLVPYLALSQFTEDKTLVSIQEFAYKFNEIFNLDMDMPEDTSEKTKKQMLLYIIKNIMKNKSMVYTFSHGLYNEHYYSGVTRAANDTRTGVE